MSDKKQESSTLASVIRQGVENRLKDVHTAMPGIIRTFNATEQTASVQPGIRRVFKERGIESDTLIEEDLPLLINVPVIFPRGGGFSMTFPVQPDDECLIVFNERSIDGWHLDGEVKKPSARRMHALSDAVVYVGLSSLTNKVLDYDPVNTEIKKDDGSVSIKWMNDSDLSLYTEANLNIDATADIIANCENIEVTATSTATVTCPESTFNGNVTVNGNITFTGVVSGPTANIDNSLTIDGKELKDHTHDGSPTAPNGPVTPTGANQ